ncbi:MAG: RDD family protein [Pseudomonadota bacterium]
MSTLNNPYAAPQAAVKDVGSSAGGFELASRGSRFLASLLDGLVIICAVGLVFLLTPWSFDEVSNSIAISLFFGGVGLVVWVLVNGYLLSTRGQTVGKIALKIRVVRQDGSRASALRLIGLRYVVPSLVNGIPFVGTIFSLVNPLMIFRDSRACLHDNIADTMVITA